MRKILGIFFVWFVFSVPNLHAVQPKFALTPLTPTTFLIATDEVATVQYRVLNQTDITRKLTMLPIQGITQNTTGLGYCTNPFTLAPNQSCILTLSLDGNTFPQAVIEGPEICKTQSATNNAPSPFLCSRPSQADSLHIRRASVKRGGLFVEPSTLVFDVSGPSQQFNVTNASTVLTARNIRANLKGTALNGYITQDASDCETVLPGQICTLIFTPGTSAISLSSFPIRGDNTRLVGASIEIRDLNSATITTSGSPLVLGTNSTGTITVTNTSSTINASNVRANLTSEMLNAGIVQDATNCASLPQNSSCTLSFTSSTTAVSPTIVSVNGSNTSIIDVSIGVNAPSQQAIAITSSLPLVLNADGTSAGTITIANNSSAEVAAGVTANFESTNLNGFVSSSVCEAIPVNGSCTLTFTAGRTDVSETDFPIYGANTTAVLGSIEIVPASYAYLTSNTNNNLYQCIIASDSGNFTECQTFSNLGFTNPRGIVINPAKTRAYIISHGDPSTVRKCDIDPANHNLTNCQNANANGLGSTYGMAINPAGTIAYFTNGNNRQFISQCPINPSTGGFDNGCTDTGQNIETARGIVISPDNQYAYIAGHDSMKIYRCAVNSGSGALSSCSVVYNTSASPYYKFNGITMNAAGSLIYMSVYNKTLQVICPPSFTGCNTVSFSTSLFYSAGIAVNEADSISYIANTGTCFYYSQFALNGSGLISDYDSYCSTIPTNIWGIALLE